MATRRTTMRSRSGKKLYAVRDESGQFKDIQTYKRAHAADMRQKSKAEKEAAQGPIEKKVRKAAKDAVKSPFVHLLETLKSPVFAQRVRRLPGYDCAAAGSINGLEALAPVSPQPRARPPSAMRPPGRSRAPDTAA